MKYEQRMMNGHGAQNFHSTAEKGAIKKASGDVKRSMVASHGFDDDQDLSLWGFLTGMCAVDTVEPQVESRSPVAKSSSPYSTDSRREGTNVDRMPREIYSDVALDNHGLAKDYKSSDWRDIENSEEPKDMVDNLQEFFGLVETSEPGVPRPETPLEKALGAVVPDEMAKRREKEIARADAERARIARAIALARAKHNEKAVKKGFSKKPDIGKMVIHPRMGNGVTTNATSTKMAPRTFDDTLDLIAFPEKMCPGPSEHMGVRNKSFGNVPHTYGHERDLLDDVFEGRIFSGTCGAKSQQGRGAPRLEKRYTNQSGLGLYSKSPVQEPSFFEKFLHAVAFPEQACVGTPSQIKYEKSRGELYDQSSQRTYQAGLGKNYTPNTTVSSFLSDDASRSHFSETKSQYYPDDPDEHGNMMYDKNGFGRFNRHFGLDEHHLEQIDEQKVAGHRDGDNDYDDEVIDRSWAVQAPKTKTEMDFLDHLCTGVEKYTCGSDTISEMERHDAHGLRRDRSLVTDTDSATEVSSARFTRGMKNGKQKSIIGRFMAKNGN